MRLRPDWAVAYVTLGRAQLEHGEPALSVDTLTQAAALDPANAAQSDAASELARVTAVLERMHLQRAEQALADTKTNASALPGAECASPVMLHHVTCSHYKPALVADDSLTSAAHGKRKHTPAPAATAATADPVITLNSGHPPTSSAAAASASPSPAAASTAEPTPPKKLKIKNAHALPSDTSAPANCKKE